MTKSTGGLKTQEKAQLRITETALPANPEEHVGPQQPEVLAKDQAASKSKPPDSRDSRSNAPKQVALMSQIAPDPDLDDPASIPESAYQRALSSFSDEERARLGNGATLTQLFQHLDEADQAHLEKSFLRRGLRRVKPFLERVNATINFISPFAEFQPALGTALGLIQGSSTVSIHLMPMSFDQGTNSMKQIAIAICGCFEDLTKEIASFLERLPVIDRCAEVVKGDGRLKDIYKASTIPQDAEYSARNH